MYNRTFKRILATAGIVMMAVSAAACGNKSTSGEVKSTGADEQVTTTAQETASSSEAAAQEAAAGVSKAAAQPISTVSSKGYSIEVIDGITYVDGILIANKTYALPSSYAPGDITPEVKSAFAVMQQAAASQGLNLYISSGFRSYERQSTLYNRYVNADGKALADTYSARAGHSEHQTGLCFDLNTIDDSFANTPESAWLEQHAQEYGFIIRYGKGKENVTGYQYEPWHLRYLGVDLATKVYNTGLSLEEYLGITSEYQN